MGKPIILKNSGELIPIEEHFKLSAGPGAGKTKFLINHILNVIKNSKRLSNYRKIACITYTNIGVETIQKRLGNTVNEVEVSTIHSFLYKHIVKYYLWTLGKEFQICINGKEYTFEIDIENLNYSLNVVPSCKLFNYKEFYKVKNIYGYENNDILEPFNDIQWELNDYIDLRIPKMHMPFPKDFIVNYKINCWKKGLLNPDDILVLSYLIINKNERILEIIRAKFPYIFVDEFQDTNPFQTKILDKISEKETVIGVIGDYAQSIYSFQGAEVENFKKFKDNIIKEYRIETNYRSTDKIIKLLNHIRTDDIKQIGKGVKGENPKIIVGLEKDLCNLIKEKFNIGEIYLLFRKHRKLNEIELFFNDKSYKKNKFIDSSFGVNKDYKRFKRIKYIVYSLEMQEKIILMKQFNI